MLICYFLKYNLHNWSYVEVSSRIVFEVPATVTQTKPQELQGFMKILLSPTLLETKTPIKEMGWTIKLWTI